MSGARIRWIAALVLGLGAGGLHLAFLRNLEAEVRGGEMVEVLVARDRIGGGTKLERRMVAARSVPEAWVDERAVSAGKLEEVEGLAVAVTLQAGQTMQWTDFEKRPDPVDEDLSSLVEPGQRAMAIPVDSSLSLGGMLSPGHRVDVLGTFAKGKSSRTEKVTVTLLQNVMVLATGRDLGAGSGRYSTVTMSVGLEEAELLAFASTQGTLSLVLRGGQDLAVVRDVPEKGMEDVWEAERRNALQQESRTEKRSIERLQVR
jgi:pilus assembly protein CpaB